MRPLPLDDLREPPAVARYAVALLVSALALLLTWLFRSFMERNLFLWFFAAIVIGSWYGGLGPGLLVTVIATVGIGFFFLAPVAMFQIGGEDLLRLGVFALVALLISSLTEARRRSALSAQARREQLRVTLSSIGDAMIATDVHGRVTMMNAVAEALTGWSSAEAQGQAITSVFRIVNEDGRQPVESPVERALREGAVVGLANHTLLIAKDGSEHPIDDSGAPIRDAEGNVAGVVLVFRDITTRKQAEQTLARYQLLSENARDIMLFVGGDGRIVEANRAAVAAYGYDRETLLGKSIYDLRDPASAPAIGAQMQQADSSGILFETIHRRADGTLFPVEVSSVGATIDQQRVLVSIIRDITARRRIEAAQAQLAAIVESTDDAIVGKALDGTILSWNTAAERMYGYTAAEAIGRSIQMLAPPGRADEIPQLLELLKRGERVARLETTRRRKDGSILDVSLTISPIRDSSGAITAASTIARDITERKRTAERGERLQAIASALAEALTPAEVADVIISQALAAVGGQAGVIALLGQDAEALEIVGASGYPEQMLASWQRLPLSQPAPLTDAVRSKKAVMIESRAALAERYPRLERQSLAAHNAWAALPLLLEGRATGALGLSFAASRVFSADERAFLQTLASQCAQALERARLYEAEHLARANAESAVRLRDQFLSIAAHELKTPLTSLLGYAQLFQRRTARAGNLSAADQRALGVIVDQAGRLNRMVAALLDITRIETGQLSISRAPLDLCELTQRVGEEAREQVGDHPLEISCPAGPLMIEGDDLRLEQVLQNLIQNAAKYSSPGTPVTVRVRRQGTYARIDVVDRGMGIPETALPRLFQRFYRAPNVDDRQISGMGIGLYVVKEIVLLHNGTIEVESTEGQGSTFTVRLPLIEEGDGDRGER
ncbi:MAG TPA: PAS domain S-box protein [Roseiflexaceae bacterium]|nr:PAS domain S-box protein [Roseiflexaceae bacterium]